MTDITAKLTLKSGEQRCFHASSIIAHDLHSLADAVIDMQKQINKELTQLIEVESAAVTVCVNGNKSSGSDEEEEEDGE